VSLAHPYLLFLLPLLPLIVAVAVLASRHKRKQWQEFVADRLRPRLINRASALPRILSFSCLLAAIALMILGLTRWQYEHSRRTENTRGRNLVIVLDLSRSMQAADLKPSRLAQAKALLYELLETLPNDRIGVVGFTSSPYLFAPLTIDHSAVRETVEQLDSDSIPTGGSDMATAVKLAVSTLKETGQANNGLLILSDGEEHSPGLSDTLDDIKKSGTYVFAVGIGTEDGSFIPDRNYPDGRFRDVNGETVITRMQPDTLRSFAEQSGGRFALAESAAAIPRMVSAAVADLDSFELKGREKIYATELFQWFIFPAILLLMTAMILGTRWRPLPRLGSTATALFCFALFTPYADAKEPKIADARQALQTKDYKTAQSLFEQLARDKPPLSDDYAALQLGKASADYRLGEYAEARQSYSRALAVDDSTLRATAHQGLGNTLFQLGWMELADGQSFPGGEEAEKQFDELLPQRIKEWMEEENNDNKEPSAGFRRMETILLNWADAARHSQAATTLHPDSAEAKNNSRLARHYLEKLRQKMEEQQQEMEAQMQGQGEGPEGENPGEGAGEGQDGDQGENGDQPDGQKNQGDKPSGNRPEGEKPDPNNTHGKDKKPGETKEDHALRKLNENADLQRGIVAPGQYQYRRPAKDW
jgi:Ca-activated chloride channel homolog